MSKTIKVIVILFVIYVGVVALFESMLGFFQPENQATLVMTTFDVGRQWYHRILENDQVLVRYEDINGAFTATKVDDSDEAVLHQARPLSLGFRILTGFPPRYFVELTPNTL